MKPTIEQLKSLFTVCQSFTQMYQAIYLVCLDRRTDDLVVLCGETLLITIKFNGEVNFP